MPALPCNTLNLKVSNMSVNNIISSPTVDQSVNHDASMHEFLSCEKSISLASEHEQLCVGLCSIVDGGCELSDIKPLLARLLDQSEELLSRLKHSHWIEPSQSHDS